MRVNLPLNVWRSRGMANVWRDSMVLPIWFGYEDKNYPGFDVSGSGLQKLAFFLLVAVILYVAVTGGA
jgi:hypothetical protein